MNKTVTYIKILVILFLCVFFMPGCSTKYTQKSCGLITDQDGRPIDKAIVVVSSVVRHHLIKIPTLSRSEGGSRIYLNILTIPEYKKFKTIATDGIFTFDAPASDNSSLSITKIKKPGYKTVKTDISLRNHLRGNVDSFMFPVKVTMEKE